MPGPSAWAGTKAALSSARAGADAFFNPATAAGYTPIFDRLGGAFAFAFKNIVSPIARGGWRVAKGVGETAYNVAPYAARFGAWGAGRGVRTLATYPRLAIGLTAGAGLAGMLHNTYDMTEQDMDTAAVMMGGSTGFAPGMGATREAFIQSTDGLTLGLHRGRHR